MKEYYEFNINESFYVKLTDEGYGVLVKHNNDLAKKFPTIPIRDIEYYKAKADQDGYIRFQAWDFIKLFGEYTGLLKPMYYYSTIRIKSSNLY